MISKQKSEVKLANIKTSLTFSFVWLKISHPKNIFNIFDFQCFEDRRLILWSALIEFCDEMQGQEILNHFFLSLFVLLCVWKKREKNVFTVIKMYSSFFGIFGKDSNHLSITICGFYCLYHFLICLDRALTIRYTNITELLIMSLEQNLFAKTCSPMQMLDFQSFSLSASFEFLKKLVSLERFIGIM